MKFHNTGKILKTLLVERKINTVRLSEATKIGQPVISRLITGETEDPKLSTLKALADYFNITINQLIGEAPLKETELNLKKQIKEIPIISWEEAATWPSISHKKKRNTLFIDSPSHSCLYALLLEDSSMEPVFHKGTYLIIDSNKEPIDKSYIALPSKKQNIAFLRQLTISDGKNYAIPLNLSCSDQRITLISKHRDRICGTLIQIVKCFPDLGKYF